MRICRDVYIDDLSDRVQEALERAGDVRDIVWVEQDADVVVMDTIAAIQHGSQVKEANPNAAILIAYRGNSVQPGMRARALGGKLFNLDNPSNEVTEALRELA